MVHVSHLCDMLLYAVCVTAGYLMSYWNRPFFPEWCSDETLDNSKTYDTVVITTTKKKTKAKQTDKTA